MSKPCRRDDPFKPVVGRRKLDAYSEWFLKHESLKAIEAALLTSLVIPLAVATRKR